MKKGSSRKAPQNIFLTACVVISIACTIFVVQQSNQLTRVLGINTVSVNPVQKENAFPGTSDWQMTKPALHGEIQAYVGAESVNKGEVVPLAVSVKEAGDTFTFALYRLGYYGGKGGRLMWKITGYKGIQQGYYDPSVNKSNPINCFHCIISPNANPAKDVKDSNGQETYITDANWAMTNQIPTKGFTSGIYMVKLTENNHGYQWGVPFIVRDDQRKADLVLEDPVNTDQAYNLWGGTNFYQNYRLYPSTGSGTAPYWAFYASFNRPYLQNYGTGHLFYWMYPMLAFLEEQGYDVAYTTNNAVAQSKTNLLNYKGYIVAGHDEYVSFSERKKIEEAVANGVSIAFFAANDLYWQTRTLPDLQGKADRFIVEYKDFSNPRPYDPYNTPNNPSRSLTTTLWRAAPVSNPEDTLLKAMYPIGGGNYSQYGNFIATNTSNWIYTGTGLKDGDAIHGILGLEIDSQFPNDGSIMPSDHITLIGSSPFISQSGQQFTAHAVLDELSTKNIIFNAGTISWSHGLSNYPYKIPSDALRTMTNNILYRMIHGTNPPVSNSLYKKGNSSEIPLYFIPSSLDNPEEEQGQKTTSSLPTGSSGTSMVKSAVSNAPSPSSTINPITRFFTQPLFGFFNHK